MKKLILILFISFGLNGCITLDKGKSTNLSKKSNVVSTKKITSINQTKETVSNIEKPDLTHLDYETKSIIEMKCILTQREGVVPYWNCLRDELKTIGKENNKKEEVIIVKKELKKKKTQEENKDGKVKFIQWKCFEHFGSDAKHILTIGYFPQFSEVLYQENTFNKLNHSKKDKDIVNEFLKIFSQSGMEFGMMDLKSTSKQLLAFYRLKGVQHSFMWGGKNFMDYSITINSSGRGYFYNFEGAKQGESRNSTETFDCKSGYPETVWLVPEDLADFMNNLTRLSQSKTDRN